MLIWKIIFQVKVLFSTQFLNFSKKKNFRYKEGNEKK